MEEEMEKKGRRWIIYDSLYTDSIQEIKSNKKNEKLYLKNHSLIR